MEQILDYRIDMTDRSQWKIISAGSAAKQHLLYLQEAGVFYSGPGYYTTRSGLDSYLIKLTLSGAGTLEYNGGHYRVEQGDFFWIDCKNPQDYRTAPEADHWHILWIQFYGTNAADYYALFTQLNGDDPVGHLGANSAAPQLMELLMQLYPESSGEPSTDIRCASVLTQLLTCLLDAVSPAPLPPRMPPSIQAIRDHIQQNYNQPITLQELSERFNISKFYLQRTFSRYMGQSPSEYQQKLRLTKAKELLRTTNMSINMIAFSVGFESTSAFISVFKKQEDITPLKYRNAWSNSLKL